MKNVSRIGRIGQLSIKIVVTLVLVLSRLTAATGRAQTQTKFVLAKTILNVSSG